MLSKSKRFVAPFQHMRRIEYLKEQAGVFIPESMIKSLTPPRDAITNAKRAHTHFDVHWKKILSFYDRRCVCCGLPSERVPIVPDMIYLSPFPVTTICPARFQPLCICCSKTNGSWGHDTDTHERGVYGRLRSLDHRPGGWRPLAELLAPHAFMPLCRYRFPVFKENTQEEDALQETTDTPPFIFE